MKLTAVEDCLQPELAFLERPKYFARQLLSEVDLVTEQNYHRAWARRHNRFLHGWGVVCGLEVKPAPTISTPWRVSIEAGFALGPRGYDIWVAEKVYMDLAECGPGAISDPCDPGRLRGGQSSERETLFLAIQYAECFSRPVRVPSNGCGCDEEDCQYSRIRDSFQIECLPELPPSHQPDPDFLCDFVGGEILPSCLPCPDDPWVVLAEVKLPASPNEAIVASNINNFVRRQLFSTAVLQEQLIACCCEKEPPEVGEADLAITKQYIAGVVGLASITPNRVILSVGNLGPTAAFDVEVIDDLPEEMTPVAGSFMPADGTWVEQSDNPLRAELGKLEAGESVTLEFHVTIDRSNEGEILNTALVKSSTPDPELDNNKATDGPIIIN